MLQLLLSAIALAATHLVSTDTLEIVMDRIVATAPVATIVAKWEGRRVLLNHTC